MFEQQRRREEFPEAGQMSRPKEEGNKGTGAPVIGWGGRSGKALFQYVINNQYLLRKQKEGAAGPGDSLLQTTGLELLDSTVAPPAQPGDLHHLPPLTQALAAASRVIFPGLSRCSGVVTGSVSLSAGGWCSNLHGE